MVVQPGESNFCDQRLLHFELKEIHSIPCERATLRDVHQFCRIDESSGQLYFGTTFVVSVVYFRAGYSPGDYPTEDEWSARSLLENSKAVKCPNIGLHLAGSKKVQQELARPNVLERYLSIDDSNIIRASFAGLYALDDEKEVDDLRARATLDVNGYVLKPQREGGGNNFYSDAMVDALTNKSIDELKAFILMERIQPPVQDAILVRNDVAVRAECISELGIFGVYLSNENDETTNEEFFMNDYAGYLLRIKPASSDEGGVAAGFAVLGCPMIST
jgi:glutathione synthase